MSRRPSAGASGGVHADRGELLSAAGGDQTVCDRRFRAMKRGVFSHRGWEPVLHGLCGPAVQGRGAGSELGREAVSNLHVTVKFWMPKACHAGSARPSSRACAWRGEGRRTGWPFAECRRGRRLRESDLGREPIDGLQHELGVWEPKAKPQTSRRAMVDSGGAASRGRRMA